MCRNSEIKVALCVLAQPADFMPVTFLILINMHGVVSFYQEQTYLYIFACSSATMVATKLN